MPPHGFDPDVLAHETGERIKERIDGDILWALLWDQHVKIDPELESFFTAIALLHGTHPQPKFGIERTQLAREITAFISSHPGQPAVLQKVRRNYRELGGRLLDTDPEWYYTKLADAYLDWLYAQPEAMALMPAALEKIEADKRKTIDEQSYYESPHGQRRWLKY